MTQEARIVVYGISGLFENLVAGTFPDNVAKVIIMINILRFCIKVFVFNRLLHLTSTQFRADKLWNMLLLR